MSEWRYQEQIIAMAMDSFRLCIGVQPRNFTPREIAQYVSRCADPAPPIGTRE